MGHKLDYLCLQPTRQGQASYAHVNEIVAGLRRRGWQVRLVEPALPRRGAHDGLRRVIEDVRVQLRYWLRTRLRPAEFVYIRLHYLTLPTAFIARVAGSIVVQEVNGPFDDAYDAWPGLRRLERITSFALRAQLRWADRVVTVTPGLVDYVRQFCGREGGYDVIGNGAAVDVFRPIPPTGEPGRPYVVFVGALASWQGIDTVLAAAASADWPDSLDLRIAGDGKERVKVEQAVSDQSNVRWLGSIPYAEAATVLAESFAALVPMNAVPRSAHGLSPLKLFEAMACGVPVVASNLPGLADVVLKHDCGGLFPAGDAVGLARVVARLAADPSLASEQGARGRAAALAHYSWDARAAQTQAVLLAAEGGREAVERYPAD